MDLMKFINILSSFIFVLGLILGLSLILRSRKDAIINFFNNKSPAKNSYQKIKIIESKSIDLKTKIILCEVEGIKSAVVIGENYAKQLDINLENKNSLNKDKIKMVK